MQRQYRITNKCPEPLELWLEPFCRIYTVPGGSTLILRYDALRYDADLDCEFGVETVQTSDGLTIYLDAAYIPDAELDGSPVNPD